MRKSIQLGCVVSVICLTACGEPERPAPVPITLPDTLECLAEFGDSQNRTPDADIENLWAAIELGDPDAMLCNLSIHAGRAETDHQTEMLYRWYRATGLEPEGLDQRIRQLDRRELASVLRMAHEYGPELTDFPEDRRGCPDYDEVATELLMRVEYGDQRRRCLPRRWWW